MEGFTAELAWFKSARSFPLRLRLLTRIRVPFDVADHPRAFVGHVRHRRRDGGRLLASCHAVKSTVTNITARHSRFGHVRPVQYVAPPFPTIHKISAKPKTKNRIVR